MPAPSWPALRDFEKQWDAALAAILAIYAAAPYRLQLCGPTGTENKLCPRLEYFFELGAPTGPGGEIQVTADPAGAASPTAYEFTLRFILVHDPLKITAEQRALPGQLRTLLSPPAPGQEGAFSATALPWLAVSALAEQRAFRGTYPEGDKDYAHWTSEWSGVFSLRLEELPA